MANETSALRGEPQHAGVAEDDYQSFSAALGASARGRAFLHEYARRNRHADTEVVLAALDRLESVARSQKSAPEAERIRQDLRALLDTIHSARPQIDSTPGAIKAATLAALIEFVQARIEALVQPMNAGLVAVPELEQPELPIPQPGSAAQRTIALVQAIAAPPEPLPAPAAREAQAFIRNFDPDTVLAEPPRSTKIIPEVNFIDSLFDAIDAKAKAESKAKTEATAKTQAEAQARVETQAQPAPATPAGAAAMPVAAILPSLDMQLLDLPAPVSAQAAAPVVEATEAIAQTDDDDATEDDAADTIGMAVTISRASVTAAAINASAAAIDEIVAAAEAVMAEEAARAQTPRGEASFLEDFVSDVAPVAAAPADDTVAAVAPEPATSYFTDAIGKTAAGPAQHPTNNALAAIMALSEEERLAMFT